MPTEGEHFSPARAETSPSRIGSAPLASRSPQLALQIATAVAFAVAAASGCFAALAVSVRFGGFTSRFLDNIAKGALGLYVVHYPFTVWLQYALLGLALFAFAKWSIVFGLSTLLSMALMILFRRIPFGALLVGETPRPVRFRLPRFRERTEKPHAAIPLADNPN